jgi:hypothetical protein
VAAVEGGRGCVWGWWWTGRKASLYLGRCSGSFRLWARSRPRAVVLSPDPAPPGSRQRGGAAAAALLPGVGEKAAVAVSEESGPVLVGSATFSAAAGPLVLNISLNTRASSATCVCFCLCVEV